MNIDSPKYISHNAILLSLPWADFNFPSFQIAHLSAYAKTHGYKVDTRHLHLELASLFGPEEYEEVAYAPHHIGELLCMYHLFPEQKKAISSFLKNHIKSPKFYLDRLFHDFMALFNDISWNTYSLIGFTVHPEQLMASLLFAKWIKEKYADKIIVLGGPLAWAEQGKSIIKCFPQIDCCIDGEGELALIYLLKHINKIAKNWHKIPGAIYRYGDLLQHNSRLYLKNLANLPIPDYDQYFNQIKANQKLSKLVNPYITVESSRGCNNNCFFCPNNNMWDNYRVRPAQEVANQIKALAKKYETNVFQFVDQVVRTKGWKELFNSIIKHNIDYELFYEIRANTSKDQLKLMKKAGVKEIQIGIETFSSNLLKKMNKETRVIDNIQAMKFCEEINIFHISNLIIDYPTETKLDIEETISNITYAYSYRPPSFLAPFMLVKGTEIYKNYKKYNISKISDSLPLRKLLPDNIANDFSFIKKSFELNKPLSSNNKLTNLFNQWHIDYDYFKKNNDSMLAYYDMGNYIIIEDLRHSYQHHVLEKEYRKLYLYCDSYKNLKQIIRAFPNIAATTLQKKLNKLVRLKLMFKEDNDYLSLAIKK